MSESNYSVTFYSRNNLFQEIARHTSRSLHEIQKKRQIKYLADLLERVAQFRFPEARGKMTILVEHDYVHRATLHDYSEFNVFSFFDYSRHCVRLNFFHGEHSEKEISDAILGMSTNAMNQVQSLQQRFIGSMILRKNQVSFLAQVNLPHPFSPDDHLMSLPFQRSYAMGPFGIPVTTNDCVAWVEQDRVVSACASSALFIMFHALRLDLFNPGFPSPARITRIAVKGHSASSPVFPNRGLTPEMMARVIQAQGMEPYHVNLGFKEDDNVDEEISRQRLLRSIHAYTRLHIASPIMGMRTMKFLAMVKDVGKNWESQIKENNNIKCFGITKDTRVYSRNAEHAVTVIGYGLWKKPHEDCQKLFISSRNNSDPSSAGYYSVADSIPFIVVHDDQTGPYVRCVVREDNHGFLLSETPDLCRVSAGNIPKGFFHYHIANVLDSSIKITDEQLPEEEQTYRSVPELLLMGLHPKIRLHLQSVEALVVHFETMLSKLVMETSLRNDALGYELLGILQHGNTESISGKKSDRIIHYLWDIYLDRNTEMKYELRKQFHADERPVNDDGMEVLEQRWPLFVWRACARDASGRVFDIFFDATHTLSDNMVIQILIYRNKIDSFVKPFFHSIVGTTDNELYHLWSESIIFLHWMKQIIPSIHGHAHEETLSEKFGHLHLPSHLKAWEQDANGLCKSFNDDERLIFHDTNAKDWTEPGKMLFKWLNDGKSSATFIWLIDGHGRLIIGKERPVDQQHPNDMLGHPALVAGGRARIAGELKWDELKNSFQVNNRSGRYTKKSVNREESHLNTVVGWMNRIAEICQSNRKFFMAFDKDYGADLINSIFDLRKEISEILDIPGSNLRRSGEELGRKLAFSGAMMDKINEALSLANQWDPTDRTRVKTILSHALAPWLEQCQPQNLDETLLRQLQLTLSDWFSAGDVDLSNATLEVFVIIHSISPQSNQMVRNTLEHYAREHAFSLDAQNPTLMRIRQFLVNSKIASS